MMARRQILAVAAAACGGLLMAAVPGRAMAERPKEEVDPHRVALHLNSDDDRVQKGALSNIKNLYEEFGPGKVKIELVANGPGIKLFVKKETKFAEELVLLKTKYGVEYTVCSNTMKAMKLTREDLVEQVDRTVPAVVRLIDLQEKGWAYIKS